MEINKIKDIIFGKKIEVLSIFLFITTISFLYILNGSITLDNMLIAIILASIPIMIYKYLESKLEQQKLSEFIRFSLDLTELLKSGIPLPIAMKELEKNYYGVIDDSVKRLIYRIRWGIDIETSFKIFKEELNSKNIDKILDILIDVYKSGGDLGKSLNSLVTSIIELDRLIKRRESSVYENILHSYIVFLFFLGVAIVIVGFLVPFLNSTINIGDLNMRNNNIGDIGTIMFHLAIIQSVFSGLLLGKMYRGNYKAGFKHIVIFLLLVIITFKLIIPIVSKYNIVFQLPQV